MSNSFNAKLSQGKVFENFLCEFLDASPAPLTAQKLGIDMVLPNGITVECKHDIRGGSTGNFYAELITGLNNPKPGCLFTTIADFVVLKFGGTVDDSNDGDNFYIFKPQDFRVFYNTTATKKKFKVLQCCNPNGYGSVGVLIPKKYLTDFSIRASINDVRSYLYHGYENLQDNKTDANDT